MKIIEIKTVDSTNNYASELLKNNLISEDTIIFAHMQTKGKGLGKNSWTSDKGKNLLFSLVTFPEILISDHFLLSMSVSLGVCDYVENKGIKARIKWPNDIYVKNKKLCGILIENTVLGDLIKSSVIGIGINVNQTHFPEFIKNIISISNITGKQYDIKKEINLMPEILKRRLMDLKNKSINEIKKEYLNKLYRFKETHKFKISGNIINAIITDVQTDGHIVLQTENGNKHSYYFKEIEFVLD